MAPPAASPPAKEVMKGNAAASSISVSLFATADLSRAQILWPLSLQVQEREITIRPRNASKVDGTHLEFSLEVLHIQTTASTNTRQQPSDPHAKRTISWWNVHPERYEHIAVEYAQMQGIQKQDAVFERPGQCGPSWPWAQMQDGLRK